MHMCVYIYTYTLYTLSVYVCGRVCVFHVYIYLYICVSYTYMSETKYACVHILEFTSIFENANIYMLYTYRTFPCTFQKCTAYDHVYAGYGIASVSRID